MFNIEPVAYSTITDGCNSPLALISMFRTRPTFATESLSGDQLRIRLRYMSR